MRQYSSIGKYQLTKKIDESGVKTIYRAQNIKSGQNCFLTIVPSKNENTCEILSQRAQRAMNLKCKGIVLPFDYGTTQDGYFYYVTPAIPSLPIKDVLELINDRDELFFTLASFMIETTEIIGYIHRGNITHRDLMTQSLRIDSDNKLWVEGFVNSRLKVQSPNVAKNINLPYTAPEILMGAPTSAQSDIYSLGVIIYELLCNKLPYESNYTKLEAFRKGEVDISALTEKNIPESLQHICRRAMSKSQFRYNSMEEMSNDLRLFYSQRPLMAKLSDLTQTLTDFLFSRK